MAKHNISLRNNVIKIAAKDSPAYKDPAVYVAGGGALVAAKLRKDLSSMDEKLVNWERGMDSYASRAKEGKMGLDESIKAIEAYNAGGRAATRQRILGVRAGDIMGEGRYAIEKAIRAKDRVGKKLFKGYNAHIKSDHELMKMREHYKLFESKSVTDKALFSHMIEKGINDLRHSDPGLQEWVHRDAPLNDFIKTYPNSGDTLETHLGKLKDAHPDSYKRLVEVIAGGKKNPGEAVLLSGDEGKYLSVPKIYRENLRPVIGAMKKALPYMGIAGAGYVGYRLADDKIEKNLRKKAESIDLDKGDKRDAALTAAGAAAIYGGATKTVPKGIGITYGTMPSLGEGHKSPANAIKKILERDKRFKGVPIDEIPRDANGIFIGGGKKYNTVVDTGLGAYIPHPNFSGTMQTHGESIPHNIKTQKRVGYLTDVVHPGGGTSGAIPIPGNGKMDFITYGPNADKISNSRHVRQINAGHNMSPATDPDIIKEIVNTKYDKGTVLDDIISHAKKSNESADDIARTVAGLESLRGKKIITISGSGRGDYVYARARQLAQELKKSKMDQEYGVLAITATGKGSPMARLIKGKDVVDVGRLPKSLFVGAQNIAEAHWGSTGTSSMMESMVSDKPQLLQDVWGGKFFTSEDGLPKGSIARYQERLLRGYKPYSDYNPWIKHVETDQWNKGNRALMETLPGVAKVKSGRDVVDIIRDPERLNKLMSESKIRQLENNRGYQEQTKNMTNKLYKIYRNNKIKSNLAKAGLVAVGGTMAAIGLKNLATQGRTDSKRTPA